MESKKKKIRAVCKWAAIGIGLLAAAGFLAAMAVGVKGKRELAEPGKYLETAARPFPDSSYLFWEEELHAYREGIINILCLGIDGRGKAQESEAIGFGPKADFILLAVFDTKENKLTFLDISRDCVTPIRWFDSSGRDGGLVDYQLGLQYTLGNGLDTSCMLMEEAVSRMLGGVPIHGYCALYWKGVEALQEQVGSVTVVVPEELSKLDPVNFLYPGETELTPEQARIYVQGRDVEVTGSNEIRFLRQKEYMKAMYQKIRELVDRNPFSLFPLKEALEEYIVTDLEWDELLVLAREASKTSADLELLSVPGETVATMFQDEFHIHETKFAEMKKALFYE